VGENVLLKVKPNNMSLNLGSYTNLVAIFCGPFEILDRIGTVAYILALSASIACVECVSCFFAKKICT
jgi:hypothetical protein